MTYLSELFSELFQDKGDVTSETTLKAVQERGRKQV